MTMRKLADIKELVEKYQLPEEDVKEEVERAVSSVLSGAFGFEVWASYNGSLQLWGFRPTREGIEPVPIQTEAVSSSLIRCIKYGVASALLNRSVYRRSSRHKYMVGTVVTGKIFRILPGGTLSVEIQGSGLMDGILMGTCSVMEQTPKERGGYREGEEMPFLVLNVASRYDDETPRFEIHLSRTSKGLSEGLLRQQVIEKGKDPVLRCVWRRAGLWSHIVTAEKLPRECIKAVSDELKERILVCPPGQPLILSRRKQTRTAGGQKKRENTD